MYCYLAQVMEDLPSRNPIETVVDLYDLTTFRLADGSERNDDAASIMQRKVISRHCLNISTMTIRVILVAFSFLMLTLHYILHYKAECIAQQRESQ
jgi:hypothetical protein